ncbi:helix-turn-helix transcriptional regulator [Sphingomonas sp. 8AM]|uniref:helix-turn-helix transcriptional regulator n=1 Tax=Sphingomonas sp. 8AM TaxID=2653170 RepID=UPI0012F0F01E|nr:DNA-binding protein [Sphingomonas sp. 8AM]VXC80582.1 hypothetical protein SPHINGO8AM_230018 [Sphingomonas sp. 8AM]
MSIEQSQTTYLCQELVSRRWGVSTRTLEGWRYRLKGPNFVRIGGRVRYRLSDLEDFERSGSVLTGELGR